MRQRDYSHLVLAGIVSLCTGCSSGTSRIVHTDRQTAAESVKQFLIKDGFAIDKERDEPEEYRLTASNSGGFIFPFVHRFEISVRDDIDSSPNTAVLTVKDRGYVPFPFVIFTLGAGQDSSHVEDYWLTRFENKLLESSRLPTSDETAAMEVNPEGQPTKSLGQTDD